MNEWWCTVLVAGWMMTLLFIYGLGAYIIDESRSWRHLIQLYLEAQAGKQLPVEPGPATGPVSELRVPKDLLAELDRREADLT